jgi:uncharacterized membrane protein
MTISRAQLDQLTNQAKLTSNAVDAVLALTVARPDVQAWRAFLVRLMRGAAIASLMAGVIFFVAANWQDFGVVGRFVLLQSAFVIAIALALWRTPPATIGQSALLVAMMLIGAMFALFGQTYQTGADVYELFFAWAALALPLAFASQAGANWAVWWCILNVAMALFTGFLGQDHFVWAIFNRWGVDRSAVLMAPCLVNLAGAGVFAQLAATRFCGNAPQWLTRMLLAFGFFYGTAASMHALVRTHRWSGETNPMSQDGQFAALLFVAISIAITTVTLRARRDVFPLTLIAAAWIAISTTFIITRIISRDFDIGALFVIALWLIGTSTVASLMLMKWRREWRTPSAAAGAGA